MGVPPPYVPPCVPYNPSLPQNLGYQPSLAVGAIFSILFGLLAVVHPYQCIGYRNSWQLFFVFGSGFETMGWIVRTVLHRCTYSQPLSTMQIAVLIMSQST